jgi:glycosyltransferase involved in cell wall biosynthesis
LNIVIPCHNEEEVIVDTHVIINSYCHQLQRDGVISDYQIILVNNGSTDATFKKMINIFENSNHIVILDLRNNYGYQGSITAGLFYADKEMVVSIDADLQDDHTKIKEMILKHYEGFDLVLGVRKDRGSDSFFKRHAAQLYYKFLKTLGIVSVYNHGDFRLMSQSLVRDFKNYYERNRYIRGIITQLESQYACVYYDRSPRIKGETKFNLFSLFSLAVDGITSFSTIPIRFISLFGLISFSLSIIGIIFILYEKIINNLDVPGWAFISAAIIFFGGLNSLFIGVVGEYIGKTYIESKQRPLFSIRNIYEK